MSLKCPSCGFDSPPGMNFCGKCGAKLAPVCPSCGFENPPGMNFCGKCGARLGGEGGHDSTPAPPASSTMKEEPNKTISRRLDGTVLTRRDELKTVTILFVDLKGSTSIGERLPPDVVKDIMNDCLSMMEEHIVNSGGTVDKYLGDGLMALFGAPVSHEDDPRRAVEAALRIQEGMRSFARKVRDEWGVDLAARIGINTGKVLAGHVGSSHTDYTVMGDAVNLASRLESMAPPGGILISHETYRHVRDHFVCEDLGDKEVRGLVRKVKVYRVEGRLEGGDRRFSFEVAGVRPPMVGRDKELRDLLDLFRDTVSSRFPRLVTVVGSKGIGKSRLLHEFRQSISREAGGARQVYIALSGGPPGAYVVVRELVVSLFGMEPGVGADEFREYLSREILELFAERRVGEETAHLIAHLCGVPFGNSVYTAPYESDARTLQQAAFRALSRLLERKAKDVPLVVLLDDIHNADRGSLDALQFLPISMQDVPVFMLASARDDDTELIETFERDLPNLSFIRLKPLGGREMRNLVTATLRGVEGVKQRIVDVISEMSSGNPFYFEEIVKDLVDRGVIRREEDVSGKERWIISDVGKWEGVPSTLEGLVQSRLDRLPVNHKILLQEASIVGRDFWESVLERIERESPPESFDGVPLPVAERLRELERRGFVFRSPVTAFPGESQHTFRHAMVQEVAYGSVPRRLRAKYHLVTAEWLEEKSSPTGEMPYALLAYHYERAGKDEVAVEWYYRAGETARRLHNNVEAIDAYTKVIEKSTDASRVRECKKVLADLFVATGAFDRAEKMLRDLLQVEENPLRRLEILVGLGKVCESRGDYTEALERYDDAERLLEEAESPLGRVRVLRGKAGVYMRRGENEKALSILGEAVRELSRVATSGGDEGVIVAEEAATTNMMGLAYRQVGKVTLAMECFHNALQKYRDANDRRGEGFVLNNMGVIFFGQGDYEQARRYYERWLEIAERIGDMQGQANGLANMGLVHQAEYNYDEAVRYLQDALSIRRRIGDRAGVVNSLVNLAIVNLAVGDTDEVGGILAELDGYCRKEDNPTWRWYERFCRSEMLRLKMLLGEAVAASSEALRIARGMENPAMVGWSLQQLAECRILEGGYREALDLLDEAIGLLEPTGDRKSLFVCLLGMLQSALGLGDRERAAEVVDRMDAEFADMAADRELSVRMHALKASFMYTTGLTEEAEREAALFEEALDRFLERFTTERHRHTYRDRPDVKLFVEMCERIGRKNEKGE